MHAQQMRDVEMNCSVISGVHQFPYAGFVSVRLQCFPLSRSKSDTEYLV